jgi:hypothetical protein
LLQKGSDEAKNQLQRARTDFEAFQGKYAPILMALMLTAIIFQIITMLVAIKLIPKWALFFILPLALVWALACLRATIRIFRGTIKDAAKVIIKWLQGFNKQD